MNAKRTIGGLSLVWKEGLTISLRSFSKSLNDMEVDEGNSRAVWRFIGFYGSLVEHVRKELWNVLKQLKNSSRLPWLILGDFNKVMFSFEKKEDVFLRRDKCWPFGNCWRSVV